MMEELLSQDTEFRDDNHSVFCWAARRLYKQPNKDPSGYWSETKYPTEVKPNLREALYTSHLMQKTVSSKVLGWAHNVRATVAFKYYTHSQSTAKNRKSNIQLEASDDLIETRAMSMVARNPIRLGEIYYINQLFKSPARH